MYNDQDEWEEFRKADAKQWEKHLDLGAVEIDYPEEAKAILRTKPGSGRQTLPSGSTPT